MIKNKKYQILLFSICIAFLLCLNYGLGNNTTLSPGLLKDELSTKAIAKEESATKITSTEVIDKEESVVINCLGVADLYDTKGMMNYNEFFSDNSSLSNLKEFNAKLNTEFEYFELGFQHLEQDTYYAGDKKFSDFDVEENLTNQVVNVDGNVKYVTPFKTVHFGQRTFNLLFDADDIYEGVGFNDADFTDDATVPVILGYDYKEFYHLGDILELNYIFKPTKFEVIGFFKENTTFTLNISEYNLNQYICLPYFDIVTIPEDKDAELFQLRYYLQKNHGYIAIPSHTTFDDKVLEKYKTSFSNLSNSYDLNYMMMDFLNYIIREPLAN